MTDIGGLPTGWGAPQNNLSYPVVASTEHQNDNQLGMRIPHVNSLKKSKMRCQSPLSISNSLASATNSIPFWPKLLPLAIN